MFLFRFSFSVFFFVDFFIPHLNWTRESQRDRQDLSLLNTMGWSWGYWWTVVRYDTISCQPLPFDELLSGDAEKLTRRRMTFIELSLGNRRSSLHNVFFFFFLWYFFYHATRQLICFFFFNSIIYILFIYNIFTIEFLRRKSILQTNQSWHCRMMTTMSVPISVSYSHRRPRPSSGDERDSTIRNSPFCCDP